MASDGEQIKVPVTQAPTTAAARGVAPQSAQTVQSAQSAQTAEAAATTAIASPSGKAVPGTVSAPPAEPVRSTSPSALVTFLNQYLNDSGFPDQFRVDPASDANIQEINPANGKVIAEYSTAEFPALARSVGVTRGLVDGSA